MTKNTANNPFQMAKAQRTQRAPRIIDPAKLMISDDPILGRAKPPNKYQSVFEKMRPGQCIVCHSDDATALCSAMKKWIENTGIDCVSKFTTRYSDGKGRVWLVANPQAEQAGVKLKAAA